MAPTSKRPIILLALFLSGMAGLIHEIVWAKLLVTLIGSTAHAQAVVLTVFMGGLALGSYLYGRRSDRTERPLKTYVRLELLIGAYCLVLPFILRLAGVAYDQLGALFFESTGLKFAVRFVLALLVVLAPAVMMGGTLPLLARHLITQVAETRRAVASLYALNNIGAVLGAGLAGFVTLGAFGIYPSLALAAALNFIAAGLVARIDRVPEAKARKAAAEALVPYSSVQHLTTLVALLCSGFAAMGYEVLFTRVIALSFGSSTHSFTVMLMSFITGIGIGSAIVARSRVNRPLWWLALSQLLVVVALVAVTPLLARLPYFIARWRLEVQSLPAGFELDQVGKAALCLLVLLVPTTCLGMGFPLVAQVQARSVAVAGNAVGSTYAWNTVGNVLGVLITSLVLVPLAGVLGSFHVNLSLNLAAGLMLLFAAREATAARRWTVLGGAALALAVYVVAGTGWTQSINFAKNHLRLRDRPDPRLSADARAVHPASSFASWRQWFVVDPRDVDDLYFEEDANTTVLAVGADELAVLYVNTKPDASCAPSGSDLGTQLMLAHLPLLLTADAKSVLVIGYGSGVTCGSALLHPIEHADLVEISRGVLNAHRVFAPFNDDALHDPRLTAYCDDARTFLRTVPRRYDVIISEPSNPWIAGIGGLFTEEFFAEARAKLNPGGTLCVWFHEYEQSDAVIQLILRTLNAVFPNVNVFRNYSGGAEGLALASLAPLAIDFAKLEDRFDRPGIRDDLARIGITNLASLLVHHATAPQSIASLVGSGPLNTDDHQRLEYLAPAAFFRNDSAAVLWQYDGLFQSGASDTQLLLDRYRAYRATTPEPITAAELDRVAQHLAIDLGEDHKSVAAVRARAARAAHPAASPTRPARGGAVDVSSMGFYEAYARGRSATEAGNAEQSLPYLRRAFALRPGAVSVRQRLGDALSALGQHAQAIELLEAGLAEHPANLRLRVNLGHAYYDARQFAQARRTYEEVTARSENVQALTMLGKMAESAGQRNAAIQLYQRAVNRSERYWPAVAALVEQWTRDGVGGFAALRLVDRALGYQPDNPDLLALRRQLAGR